MYQVNYPLAGGAITAGVQLLAQKPLFHAQFLAGNYREEQLSGDGGPYMQTTIRAFLPFHSDAIHHTLNLMKYERWMLVAMLRDQPARLVGNEETGAVLTHLYDAGQARSKGAGTEIEFRYLSEDKPPLYAGPLPAPGLAAVPPPSDALPVFGGPFTNLIP